ncbi:unnamed protein product [Zymoseptoria tritici ST99CH_1A5]|uniref:Peptidase M43 pregnancy-associated plasma-A domain-containing protein n=4 Tax=Zymoseptoria tritici TaxID=1047171 RepID=A0A1X7RKM5_ZYMT9|nr:unnamed protein product [Zymoseptoria tritici ST99CH_3D7]SMR46510.1 unnamed protein product [Zymoseptoria tritici ST99CH_1E4]SMR47753.1 unnamed protein product [Zymoseptoria tritici ST99CH_3D1]SMY21656.1 unnamed protein product [Zymoseptoria tritici ST99CH_1A5]
MKLLTFVFAALAAGMAHGANNPISSFVDPKTNLTIKHFNCGVSRASGSSDFNKTIKALSRKLRHHQTGTRAPALLKTREDIPITTINAYMHILTTTANAALYTKKQATKQINVMNTVYKRIGLNFKLIETDITVNDAWAVADGADMDAMKLALRKGTYADLNLYFHSDLTSGILGTCTLPSQVQVGMDKALYASDGCNINANTMPGGSLTGYNQGMTAVHETGHWLGLLHTFEGYSCEGEGDMIDDTPMQSSSTDGCPTEVKDSCPGLPGVDLIHNYMDYSSDSCYTGFTPGQVARIRALWEQYRKGY